MKFDNFLNEILNEVKSKIITIGDKIIDVNYKDEKYGEGIISDFNDFDAWARMDYGDLDLPGVKKLIKNKNLIWKDKSQIWLYFS